MSDEEKKLSLEGLQIVKPRWVNGRIVCDVVNAQGEMVISGEAEWVLDTCFERNWFIENWNEAGAKLDEMAASWGTF